MAGAESVWTGAAGDDAWGSGGNWSLAAVPTDADTAFVRDSDAAFSPAKNAAFDINVTGDRCARSLYVKRTAAAANPSYFPRLNLAAGATLSVTNFGFHSVGEVNIGTGALLDINSLADYVPESGTADCRIFNQNKTGTFQLNIDGGTYRCQAPAGSRYTYYLIDGELDTAQKKMVKPGIVLKNGARMQGTAASGHTIMRLETNVQCDDSTIETLNNSAWNAIRLRCPPSGVVYSSSRFRGNSVIRTTGQFCTDSGTHEFGGNTQITVGNQTCLNAITNILSGDMRLTTGNAYLPYDNVTQNLYLRDRASVTATNKPSSGTATIDLKKWGETVMSGESSMTGLILKLSDSRTFTLEDSARLAVSNEIHLTGAKNIFTLCGNAKATVSTHVAWPGEVLDHTAGTVVLRDNAELHAGVSTLTGARARFGEGVVKILDNAYLFVRERIHLNGSTNGTPSHLYVDTTRGVKCTGIRAPYTEDGHTTLGAGGTAYAPQACVTVSNGTVNLWYYGLTLAGEYSPTRYSNHNFRPDVTFTQEGGTVEVDAQRDGDSTTIYNPHGVTVGAGFFCKTSGGEDVENTLHRGRYELNGGTLTLKSGTLTVGGGLGEGAFVQTGGAFTGTSANSVYVLGLSGGKGRYEMRGGTFTGKGNFFAGGMAAEDFHKACAADERSCLNKRFDGEGVLALRGGTFTITGTGKSLTVGKAGAGRLEVGPAAAVTVPNLSLAERAAGVASAELKFTLGAAGCTAMKVTGTVTVADTAKLTVDATELDRDRLRVTLMEFGAWEGDFADADIEIVGGRPGARIERTATRLLYRVETGTQFIIR